MVLVYCKSPRGILHVEGYRIHGRETGRDPVDLPWDLYLACKDGLEDATYREGYLTKIYGKQFPAVAFTYTELRFVPESTLDLIGPLMRDDYSAEWSRKGKVDKLKFSLRDKSPCLSNP